jgi:hypothetical protein
MPVRKIGFLSLMFAAGALSQTLTTLYSFTGGADGLRRSAGISKSGGLARVRPFAAT